MTRCDGWRWLRVALLGASMLSGVALIGAGPALADVDDGVADNDGQLPLPTGQFITPTAATGAVFQSLNPGFADHPAYRAGQAIKTALSPDGNTLLIMTSGYNNLSYSTPGTANYSYLEPNESGEYIFVFNVAGGNRNHPVQTQVISIPNTFVGLAWSPTVPGTFYASAGIDDAVKVYTLNAGQYALATTIPLGHSPQAPSSPYAPFLDGGNGAVQYPNAAGIAVSPDGKTLVVANIYNDSISVINTATNTVKAEYDLRPYNTQGASGNGVAGGETPFGVAISSSGIAYVSSIRDRQVAVVNVAGATPSFVTYIALPGAPNSLILNAAGTRLYVTQDNSDTVAVIDTATNAVMEEIDTIAPPGYVNQTERYTGAAPNSLALSPDETTLYVTNGGQNSVAVIPLSGSGRHHVSALLPTGWYPHSISVSSNGKTLYVVNGKNDPGPNPQNLTSSTGSLKNTTYPGGNSAANDASYASNQYILQLEQAGFLTVPVAADTDLTNLTLQVAANNHYFVTPNVTDRVTMAALHSVIKHIIYIVKENRTYDQVLGDLTNGANGDPSLAVFGRTITPNFHRIATNFVTLDNFFDSGEVSGNGWPWSTQGRETDFTTKTIPLDYAYDPEPQFPSRGAPYDSEGQNRTVDVGIPTAAGRQAYDPRYEGFAQYIKGGIANLLPGTNNDGAADGPNGAFQAGYIWNSALNAGLTVRNYGFLYDLDRYNATPAAVSIPELQNPYATSTQVGYPVSPALIPLTDIYFRGFDNSFPDVWREQEWAREFAGYVTNNNLPNLTLLRLMHDHMGNFSTSQTVSGIGTPEQEQADNDLSVGLVAQTVANSKYAGSTLIFVLEDDAQDGPDHMDAHRSTGYVIGPYVKHNAVVSTRYSTVNMLRTIEDILGIDHLNLNDAYQRPMTDVFDIKQSSWTYTAIASTVLTGTAVVAQADPISGKAVEFAEGPRVRPIHDAAYWAEKTKNFDWSAEDRVPADLFNRVLWEGLMPGRPYPTQRSGEDLRRRDTSQAQPAVTQAAN
jgi:YVTN family beta-propeller protein